jgi:hypothetical protein
VNALDEAAAERCNGSPLLGAQTMKKPTPKMLPKAEPKQMPHKGKSKGKGC